MRCVTFDDLQIQFFFFLKFVCYLILPSYMGQLELLFEPPRLPTAPPDLQFLFRQLNQRYWRGELPEYRCEWSSRMITTWGLCYRSDRIIRISSLFKSRPFEELSALLCHEMIHIKYAGHGPRFKRELRRIGLEGDVQRLFPHLNEITTALRRADRYIYKCGACGIHIRRRRRIRGYCAACWKLGIHSRFRLLRNRV
ncbi:MAG: hypothetical protein C5B54_04585 [Acidobacteria bacterium]|nr:MAG: hypothetical protein C5B54_04585 [Acidobacteriota bacterium]